MDALKVHDLLTTDRVDTEPAKARNFVIHLLSLSATKIADGLINPKLVLAWLLSSLGAPGYLIGALVPVREAGALLPQMAIAGAIQRQPRRKWVWALGSAVQGLAALGVAVAAITLEGGAAGWTILGCLALLAVARSACSASYKDVAARTVTKGARGTVAGAAGTAAAAVVLAFAAALSTGVLPRTPMWIAAAVAVAGALWLFSAALFVRLSEPADGEEEEDRWGAFLTPLREDPVLRRYLAVRALMISTALAPPFLVMMSASTSDGQIGDLGLMLIGSSGAAIASSYVWGRLSDGSSRRTLMISGGLAAVVFGAAAAVGLATGGLGGALGTMGFIFAGQIAYEGARAGRKTYLTDMDAGDRKTVYTALSNTIIGVLLLAGVVFGVLSDMLGTAWVLAIFAAMATVGAVLAWRMDEV